MTTPEEEHAPDPPAPVGGYPQGYAQAPGQPWPPHSAPPQPGLYYRPQTNGMAVASMVLGILWLYWVGSILALVFGYIARQQIDQSGGTQGGRGMAVAGIVLGWVGVGVIGAFIGLAIVGGLLGALFG